MKCFLVFWVVLISLGCSKPDPIVSREVVQVVGVVQDVRIVDRETVVRQSSSADDAIAGAIIGKVFFDAPTAGAIVGAANSEPTVRIVRRTDICMMIVLVDGVLMEFLPRNPINNPYYKQEVGSCALRKPGDVISVDHWFREYQSGTQEDGFRWSGINGVAIPQG